VLAVRTAELAAVSPVDEAAERRRAYDRARKAKKHSGGIPVEFSAEDSAELEVHIGTSTSREETKESKKVRKKTISALFDVPDDASEENRTFAEGKGWQRQRIDSEWQRFRDHSISKGKKHRNVAAAWRNWVTSPYQGAQNGQRDERKSVVAAADRFIERIADFDRPAPEQQRELRGGTGTAAIRAIPSR
jgi:hypothetical protein